MGGACGWNHNNDEDVSKKGAADGFSEWRHGGAPLVKKREAGKQQVCWTRMAQTPILFFYLGFWLFSFFSACLS
jgi:hypothetical protein